MGAHKNSRFTSSGCKVWKNENGEPHRKDGPAIIGPDGIEEWWWNGELHRKDGPALCNTNSSGERWYQHGMLHRDDGPAIIFSGGAKDWYIRGKDIRNYMQFQEMTGCSDEEIILLKLKWGDIVWAIVNTKEEWAKRT